MIVFIYISAISLLGMIIMLTWKSAQIRSGNVVVPADVTLKSVIAPRVRIVKSHAGRAWGKVKSESSIGALIFIKDIFTGLRNGILKIENKINRVVDSIRGRGEAPRGGEASAYLKDIGDHKNGFRKK